jgi:anti-sigma factor RsiW
MRIRVLFRRHPAEPAMTCQELVELVSAYFDGALDATDQARFEAHIAGCDACTEFIAQFRTTTGVLARLTEADLDPHVRDEMLRAFRTWRAGAPPSG